MKLLVRPDCTFCPLEDDSRLVPPAGNVRASIAVVGESPGFREEQTKAPFVGPSGEMLNWLLARAGINRDDVWVTNAALHMPRAVTVSVSEDIYLSKKKVLEQSVKYCQPRLLQELSIIKPKVILAFGNEALFSLTGKRGIVNRHGAVHPVALGDWMTYVIPMVHPAFLLRGETRHIHACVRILEKAARIARTGQLAPAGNFLCVSPFHPLGRQAAINQLDQWVEIVSGNAADIAVDVETTTEDARVASLTVVGFGSAEHNLGAAVTIVAWNPATNTFVPCWTPEESDRINTCLRGLLRSPCKKWFWNMAFDVTVLERYYGKDFKGPFGDGLHLHWLMQPDLVHRLNYAAQTYLDIGAWKTEFHDSQAEKTATHDDLLIYNAQDCLHTAQLIPILKREVIASGNEHLVDHQFAVAELARQAELTGVPIDKGAWERLYQIEVEKRDRCLAAMHEAIGAADAAPMLEASVHRQRCAEKLRRGGERSDVKRWQLAANDFTPNSPMHGRWFLFEFLGLTPQKMTKGGEEQENKLASHSYKGVLGYMQSTPLVKDYVNYSEARARITMLESVRNKVEEAPDGSWRLFVRWNAQGQKGTRWSSKLVNLQNWEVPLREIFGQPFNRRWVGADLAQVEYRIAACLAGLTELLEIFNKPQFDEEVEEWKKYDPAWDPHSMIAVEVYGDVFTKAGRKLQKALRTLVKRVVYALFYGAMPEKILQSLLEDRDLPVDVRAMLTLRRVEEIHRGFNARFPAWAEWAEGQRAFIKTRGFQVFPPLNRKRFWPVKDVEETKIRNTPIQLAAGDCVNLLFLKIDKELRRAGLDAVLCIHGHDAGYWDCAAEHAEAVKKIVNDNFNMVLRSGNNSVSVWGSAKITQHLAA